MPDFDTLADEEEPVAERSVDDWLDAIDAAVDESNVIDDVDDEIEEFPEIEEPAPIASSSFDVGELVDSASVEKDDRTFWRLGAHRRTGPLNAIESTDLVAFSIDEQAVVRFGKHCPGSAREDDEVPGATSDHLDRFGFVLFLARQSTHE